MGYTHYFKQNKPVSDEQWNAFKKDAEVIIKEVGKRNIVLMSNDDNGIIIDNNRVNLNGDETEGLDHETFYLEKDYREFNFCKTAAKPYDLAVCSLLLLANEHMPGHHDIASDGQLDDWRDAMELNAKVLGHAYKLPRGVDNSPEVSEFEDELFNSYIKLKSTKDDHKETDEKIDIYKKKGNRFNL